MSFGWLHRICETDLGEKAYNAYLTAVARHGEWYVHPLGEKPDEVNEGRRCFTKRGAEQMRREFDACERDSVEPQLIDRWETQDSIMEIHSYPVETIWVVSRWQDPPRPEVAEAGEMLQNAITRDLFFGTA